MLHAMARRDPQTTVDPVNGGSGTLVNFRSEAPRADLPTA